MKFDDALGLLGGFGRYQILVLIAWNAFYLGGGWQTMLTVFIAGRMKHWCKVPELQHLNETMQKLIAIPQTTDSMGITAYKQCSMFNYNYSAINFSDPNILDTWDINGTATEIPCTNGWVFDKSVRESTAVSQFGLVCENDWMYTLPATFQMLGLLFGAFLSGLISDRFGRKRTAMGLVIGSFGAILGGAFSDNFVLFLAMRWLSLLTFIGAYTSFWVLTIEMMPPVHRTHTRFYTSVFSSLRSFMTLTAYFIRSHKMLQIISALVVVPGIIGMFFISESPRWLISKERYREADDVCRRIAKINRVSLPQDFTLNDDITSDKENQDQKVKSKVSVIDLFRTPNMRKRTLVVWVQWFAVVFGSYAMKLNVGTLIPGNLYLNSFIIIGLSDLIGSILMLIVMLKMGRKSIIVSFFTMNGILVLAMIGLLATKITLLTTITALLGVLCIGIVFRVLYLYSGEIFPTPARNVGLGSGSSFGRIGGLISPSIPLLGKVWYGLPYVILGAFPLIAAALALLLPETKDKRLPETFVEAELFGTGRIDESAKGDRDMDKDETALRLVKGDLPNNDTGDPTEDIRGN